MSGLGRLWRIVVRRICIGLMVSPQMCPPHVICLRSFMHVVATCLRKCHGCCLELVFTVTCLSNCHCCCLGVSCPQWHVSELVTPRCQKLRPPVHRFIASIMAASDGDTVLTAVNASIHMYIYLCILHICLLALEQFSSSHLSSRLQYLKRDEFLLCGHLLGWREHSCPPRLQNRACMQCGLACCLRTRHD